MLPIPENKNVMFFSITTLGFYPEAMRADYDAARSWPDDAVPVSAEDDRRLRAAIAAGSSIRMTASGKWKISAEPAPSFAVMAAPYLASVRQARDAILNRLAGIGFAAVASGDKDTVQAIVTARTCLLDITICPAITAARDLDELRVAVSAEFQRIADALPQEARRAFEDAGIALTPSVAPAITQ